MPSVARVRDSSKRAEGYPSPSWDKGGASLRLCLEPRPCGWRLRVARGVLAAVRLP